jgi:phosphoribosylanthranilate isomerase
MFIKICGITNEEDALAAVALGADAVGFVFAPSSRQIAPSLAGDIAKRLPREIVTVGVFRNESAQRLVEIVNGIGLHAAQLHGSETAGETRWIRQRVGAVIKAFPAGHPGIRDFAEFGADVLMVDGPSPGSGRMFDWRLLEGVVDPTKLMLSGGLNPDNITNAIRYVRPFGVDVSSGVEVSPGRKDFNKLKDFIVRVKKASDAYCSPGQSTSAETPRLGWPRSASARPGDASTGAGDGSDLSVGGATTGGSPPPIYDWKNDEH